jgi:glycosyltransferase involved in cell wall biosynthesis
MEGDAMDKINLPKISIITPTLNQRQFIEQTIESVLNQNYPNLEYIVVDGGSQDGTIDLLKKYEKRLRWISERDRGQADAINKGIRMSTGDIIAYLNSDDVYGPNTLHSVSRYFMNHPEILWLTGKCRIIDEQNRMVRRLITRYKDFLLKRFSYNLLLVTNPISQPATFWKRSVMDEFGLFDVEEHLVMDYEYWLRIGRKYMPLIADDYLASFRVYTTSKTSSFFLKTFKREMVLARRYSTSSLLDWLHFLNYISIAAAYLILNTLARLKTKKEDNRFTS